MRQSAELSQATDLRPLAALLASILLSAALGTIFALPKALQELRDTQSRTELTKGEEKEQCRFEIIEDVPENLTYIDYTQLRHRSTWDVYRSLFGNAREEILILDSSSNLRASQYTQQYRDTYAKRGNAIFDLLKRRGLDDGISIRLVDVGKEVDPLKFKDAQELHDLGALERRTLNMVPLTVQHAKMIIIDGRHTLITSANLDHLSLHQKGELGVLISDCPPYAQDAAQTFENMWRASGGDYKPRSDVIPFNHLNRFKIGEREVHVAMSPESLRESGRDDDLAEMVRLIDEAVTRVDISVMDFLPHFVFSEGKPIMNNLTTALERAVSRGIQVRLMTMSRFLDWRNDTMEYLSKVDALGDNIQVKILAFPYLNVYMDRKTHGKSIVTDHEALISTSNFTPDYFYVDTGLAVIVKDNSPRKDTLRDLLHIFSRYWDSPYVYPLEEYKAACWPESLSDVICDAINSPHPDKL